MGVVSHEVAWHDEALPFLQRECEFEQGECTIIFLYAFGSGSHWTATAAVENGAQSSLLDAGNGSGGLWVVKDAKVCPHCCIPMFFAYQLYTRLLLGRAALLAAFFICIGVRLLMLFGAMRCWCDVRQVGEVKRGRQSSTAIAELIRKPSDWKTVPSVAGAT